MSVLPGICTGEAAGEIASHLTQVLRKSFTLGGRTVLSGASFGVSLFPCSAADAEGMLSNADIALYAAKAAGRSGWVVFADALASEAAERFSLENDLRGAMMNGELQLFYQPVVDGVTESVVAYEALLRWYHPFRGSVSPEVFVPLAEMTGLIHEIGVFVLMRACVEIAGWPDNERVAVNLSPRQFGDPLLATQVKNALQKSGLAPDRLELEITETALMETPEEGCRVIRELRDMGIHVVLDDFGTGFSSLSHLRTDLSSRVKIDRSFIGDLSSDTHAIAIVSAVLTMCRQLDLEVRVDGVETREQAEWLWARGCNLLQGFLYGRPGPYRKRDRGP